ncbi:hypothetical protein Pint_20045 [Pistacia integerrima]|uniref:Uncharacterized protein n=1 Tax=Pistacia integerrima TaxID=434235 RepID=A0ACC0XAC5_9ROSI|nr:hypothetical protein Pint_20045 [Pistacia integerrima]
MNDSEVEEEKSDIYSNNMTKAMGAASLRVADHPSLVYFDTVLTYRHELGMNYNFIRLDLIVGQLLLKMLTSFIKMGVKTIFCLQQNPDLEYFGVDISAIQEYAKTYDDIQHLRAEISDVRAQVEDEDAAVMNLISSDDWVVLLDENGINIGSEQMAELLGVQGIQ